MTTKEKNIALSETFIEAPPGLSLFVGAAMIKW